MRTTATLPAEPGWAVIYYFDDIMPWHTVFTRAARAWRALDGQPDLTRPILDDGAKPRPSMLTNPAGEVIEPTTGMRVFACLDDLRLDLQARWQLDQQRRRRGRRAG